MTAQIGIFFGSDTGNTEKVAQKIQETLAPTESDLFDIAKTTKQELENHSLLFLGIPTWYYGESQCDWDDFIPTLKEIDFTNKKVALFGCGDQEDYGEYFCDAMGTLRDIILQNHGEIVGLWSTEGYHFESSKALVGETHFTGLAIDEDRQPELTDERIQNWVAQVKQEMDLS